MNDPTSKPAQVATEAPVTDTPAAEPERDRSEQFAYEVAHFSDTAPETAKLLTFLAGYFHGQF